MDNYIYIVLLILAFFLLSCGVKKDYMVGEYGRQPLAGQTINGADTSDKAMLGLLWHKDSLRITLNQGRHLRAALAKKDTLYLYEGSADTMDLNTERYTLHIPERELLIIRFNDSLVYPLMPAAEPCEYPLEIRSMSAEKLNDFKQKQEENEKKPKSLPILSPNYEIYPLELRAGKYLWNVGQSQDSIVCNCMVDSSKVLLLNVDGSWLQYSNRKLINCGIMRKKKSTVYEMLDYKKEIVYFLDTTAFKGYIIGLKEDKRRWKENIPYALNEYLYIGKHSIISHKLFPCRQDSTMLLFFEFGDNFILEGTRCGWIMVNN